MKVKAESRAIKGKGGARKVRAVGKVPCVVYGRGEKSFLVQIDKKVAKSLNRGEHLTLEIDKPIDVIIKEIQLKPTTSNVIHIDFQHLHRGEKVKVRVPIVLQGVEAVAKIGGILEQVLSEVEIECLPEDIPAEIKVDVSSLGIGDSIHLKDLSPAKGRFITPMDATLITALAPKAVEEKPPPEEITPEEITEEKKVEEAKVGEKERKDEKSRN